MSKWIDSVAPEEPISHLARYALAARLTGVWKQLDSAAQADLDDVEAVHDLRVSARRAMAALKLFRELLPARRGRRMKKQLRRVRRSAGDARDLDVLVERLQKRDPPSSTTTLVITRITACRQAARKPIRSVFRRFKRRHFDERSKDLVARIRWHNGQENGHEPAVADLAPAMLRPAIENFLKAGRGDFALDATLHSFRIAGKRLRYAMEILGAAFPAELREQAYPAIEDLQERLGGVNDCAAAIAQFRDWLDDADEADRAALCELLETEQQLLEEGRRQFIEWWSNERATGLPACFERLVGLAQAP